MKSYLKTRVVEHENLNTTAYQESLQKDVVLEMVEVPQGEFLMGSSDRTLEPAGQGTPQHRVSVRSFAMGKFAVTQEQWQQVAALPKVAIALPVDPAFCKGSQHPVEFVSWQEAIEFCARLSQHTGKPYRLPSEAEWEYACRAGTTTPYHFGAEINDQLANYSTLELCNGSTRGEFRGKTTPVGHFAANGFGLYEMHGNVWEWCADPWHESYDLFPWHRAPNDGSVWDSKRHHYEQITEQIHALLNSAKSRVSRGGSWFNGPQFCTSASRFYRQPHIRVGHQGFRVCCSK